MRKFSIIASVLLLNACAFEREYVKTPLNVVGDERRIRIDLRDDVDPPYKNRRLRKPYVADGRICGFTENNDCLCYVLEDVGAASTERRGRFKPGETASNAVAVVVLAPVAVLAWTLKIVAEPFDEDVPPKSCPVPRPVVE
ncbi:MAG: hypothetical protein AAFV51_10855 [Pseudomonadota bacterium]